MSDIRESSAGFEAFDSDGIWLGRYATRSDAEKATRAVQAAQDVAKFEAPAVPQSNAGVEGCPHSSE